MQIALKDGDNTAQVDNSRNGVGGRRFEGVKGGGRHVPDQHGSDGGGEVKEVDRDFC